MLAPWQRWALAGVQAWTPASIANLRLWYSNDLAKVTFGASPPNIARWDPSGGSLGGYLSQATELAQPQWDGSHVDFNTDLLASSLASSSFRYLHDGTGHTTFLVMYPDAVGAEYMFNTFGDGGGAGIGVVRSGDLFTVFHFAATGTEHLASMSRVSPALPSVLVLEITASNAAGGTFRINGGTPATGAVVNAPSAGDPLSTLQVGGRLGAPQFNGWLGEIVSYAGILAPADLTLVRQTLASKYGVALP